MFSIDEGVDPATGLHCQIRRCRHVRSYYEAPKNAGVFGAFLDGVLRLPPRFQAAGPVTVDCTRPYCIEAGIFLAAGERHLLSAKSTFHPEEGLHLVRVVVAPMADPRCVVTALHYGEDAAEAVRRCMGTVAEQLVDRRKGPPRGSPGRSPGGWPRRRGVPAP